jgi:hypothetical protein
MRLRLGTIALVALITTATAAPAPPARRTPREGLKQLNVLIGSWRGTGQPEGSLREKQRGFWTETILWEWRFKGNDAWLRVVFDKGKYFTRGELRYLPESGRFRLALQTPEQQTVTFEGALADDVLTLERADRDRHETQRLVVTMLHRNRFLYHYEVKPDKSQLFTRRYQVGGTREGVAFAGPGDGYPECVVSGGRGTMPVSYKGKTYYVCCSGCRDAFKEEPEKYIKEYEARMAKKKP